MKTIIEKSTTWESHLVQRAAAGESVAFGILVDMHRPAIYALAMRMLRNSDDANDAVQETFVKAFKAMSDFQSDRPIRPWLSRICANCCVDLVRGRRKDVANIESVEHALSDDSQNLEDQAISAFRNETVNAAVADLPAKYREIIMMRHYRHMDVTEIAEALNKPEGTIKSWLFRARVLLRTNLQVALG